MGQFHSLPGDAVRRREFMTVVAGGVAAAAAAAAAAGWPRVAGAQRSLMPVVGFLGVLSPADVGDLSAAFEQGLSGMGFADGTNVVVEARWAESQPDRLPTLAAELVRRRAVVIAATGSGASAIAAKTPAAGVIPIVFIEGDVDPVKSGLVKSLDKPGGTITGILLSSPTLLSKRLEMLKEATNPEIVGMLVNPNSLDAAIQSNQAQEAASALGVQLKIASATNEDEIDAAFTASLVRPQIGALVVGDDFFLLSQRERIVAAAANNTLPAIYPHPAYVAAGGLMSYAASFGDAYRQAGEITANILLGKKPADIPVVQPSKFELVINRATAGALQIPGSVVASADRIIDGSNSNEASPLWPAWPGATRPPGQ
jgi:putative tryptophan/tyrosine transport system substrate-binding protein